MADNKNEYVLKRTAEVWEEIQADWEDNIGKAAPRRAGMCSNQV